MTGPEFVAFYIGLLVALTIAAGVLRSSLRGPSGDPGQLWLDAYQAAFLAGGYENAGQAAVAALTARGALRVDAGGRFVALEPRPASLHPVEDAVWTAASLAAGPPSGAGAAVSGLAARMARKPGLSPAHAATYERVEQLLRSVSQPAPGAPVAVLMQAVRPPLHTVRDQLRRMGLLTTDSQTVNLRALPALVVLAGAAVGGVRLALGMAAGRPVGYLTALLVLTVVIALVFLFRTNLRTHRGDHLVRGLRRTNAALRTSATAAAVGLAGADLALAVGLWGPSVLSGGPLDDVRRLLQPAGSSGGDSGGSGDGGGSSCGGGCGGGCGG